MPRVVKGDKVRLSQILNNLINNALKFTEEGFVHLSISMKDKKRNLIQFEVRDTGVGIPSHLHEKVFQSFQQGGSEQLLEQGGTGLGLPICERLLQMMDAKLELQSSEGFGSKFYFTIKMQQGEMIPAKSDKDLERSELNVNVLLVEDNAANQFIAASFLDKWGATFKVATNGKEAIEYVENDNSFDVILMDIKMPIMDGPTAASFIRKKDETYYKEVPIVALTASAITDIKKEGTAHLFDDYLAKPFNPKDLFKLLSKFDKAVEVEKSAIATVPKRTTIDNPKEEGGDIKSQLESYTEGDPEFLVEFAENILGNIQQLKTDLTAIDRSRDIDKLAELIHMVKPTIEILGDFDLVDQLYLLRENWEIRKYPESLVVKILHRASDIISELTKLINHQHAEVH
ncbi:MAG: ATP-binding protein [Bacteroidota bacterium]